MAKKSKVIELTEITVNYAKITIVGDTDLILHKMDAVNRQALIDKQKGKEKKKKQGEGINQWMQAITTLRWRDATKIDCQPEKWTEEEYYRLLEEDAPCISGFGLKKSIGQAVTRLGFETYSTNFNASVQVVEENIPITFAKCELHEKLIPAPTGSPMLTYINQFSGWGATFTIRYIENYYSFEQILNFIKYAGFSIGIGSGRPGKASSNYGTYHIENVEG